MERNGCTSHRGLHIWIRTVNIFLATLGKTEVSFYNDVREINLAGGMIIAKLMVSAVIGQTASLYGNSSIVYVT